MVVKFAEVFAAESKQGRAVELGVAADEVVGVRMQGFALFVSPHLFGVVATVLVDGFRAPIGSFAAHVVAALDEQDLLARGR